MVGVPVLPSDALVVGLSIPNHEKLYGESPRWSWSAGDGLGGAF